MKLAELDPVPAGVVTLIGPVIAPLGTVALIELAESAVIAAATTPEDAVKLTLVAAARFEPEIVTVVPTGPLAGAKPEIVGTELADP